MEYYVYITNNCNMNCSYCTVMLGNNNSMPNNINYELRDLRAFVDRVQKEYSDDLATICFFGGEPTLEYDSIYKIIREFKNVRDYEVEYIHIQFN